jgi:hypothetical protein
MVIPTAPLNIISSYCTSLGMLRALLCNLILLSITALDPALAMLDPGGCGDTALGSSTGTADLWLLRSGWWLPPARLDPLQERHATAAWAWMNLTFHCYKAPGPFIMMFFLMAREANRLGKELCSSSRILEKERARSPWHLIAFITRMAAAHNRCSGRNRSASFTLT